MTSQQVDRGVARWVGCRKDKHIGLKWLACDRRSLLQKQKPCNKSISMWIQPGTSTVSEKGVLGPDEYKNCILVSVQSFHSLHSKWESESQAEASIATTYKLWRQWSVEQTSGLTWVCVSLLRWSTSVIILCLHLNVTDNIKTITRLILYTIRNTFH